MRHALPLLLFLGTLPLGAGGCGGEEAPPPAPEPGAAAAPLAPLFEEEEERVPLSLKDDLEALDPAADGWPTEVLHDHAKAALHGLLEHALVHDEPGEARAWLAPDFEGSTPWRPEPLETVFEDEGSRVLRPAAGGLEERAAEGGPESLFSAVAALRAPHEDRPLSEALKIVRVWPGEAGRFRIRVLIQVSSLAPDRALQQNLRLEMGFLQAGDGDGGRRALLRSARLEDFEEIHGPGPWFAEHTRQVFGNHSWFDEEIRKGVNEWWRRADRLWGNFFMGWQGMAVGDVDGDGLEDLYVAQQGGVPNRLFLQQPDGSTREAAAEAGCDFLDLTRAAVFLDLDNDGDQDLVLSMAQHALIGWNDGRGRFPEWTPLESPDTGLVHTIAAADPDGDGDLDLYLCRYDTGITLEANPVPYHDANNGAPNIYWRNDGGRRFTNATAEVGLDQNNTRFSLAALWDDFDDDGDLDLYVANDFGRNCFYRNDGGRFEEVGAALGVDEMAASMGVTAADYDLDGDQDLYVSNMFSSAGQRIASQHDRFMGGRNLEVHEAFLHHARGNSLFRNDGNRFTDVTEQSHTALGRWAWGAIFADFNLDGYDDLYVPNGFITNKSPDDL